MIGGRAFYLNGTASGNTPEEAKAEAKAEADRLCKMGKLVRLIKDVEIRYKIWTH
jgi:hypothetical protein